MQAVAVKKFRDKTTKQIIMPGMKITVTPERFEEINSTELGVFAAAVGEEPAAPITQAKKTKGGKKNAK